MFGLNVNKEKVMALAALSQAAALVTQLAHGDGIDDAALIASARSVLNIDARSVLETYGELDDLALGLKTLNELLGGLSGFRAQSQIRYMMSMDQLATRLNIAGHTRPLVGKGLEELSVAHASTLILDEEGEVDAQEVADLYQRLGTLYQKTLSLLPPRIIVKGAKGTLSSEDNVAKLRSALFAGVRAAYLWHQLGGRRWHLLFVRKAYREGVKALL
ncbi:MAG: high frequency lysogenization protein [Saprospiraceae bacterium]|jgi:high frequency lysogenization protein